MTKDDIIIYKNEEGLPAIEVVFGNDTVWLTQQQMQQLFNKTKQNISLHIKNIFSENELDKSSTVKKSLTVQKEGNRSVSREIEFYSLDVIISVGYRVKSVEGTKFRIWANQILKDYLLNGYALNHKKLQEQSQQLIELKQAIKLVGAVQNNHLLNNDELKDTFKILTDYVYALDVLDRYDHQQLENEVSGNRGDFKIEYDSALEAIDDLRVKFGGSKLFGNEKDQSFKSSLYTIYQTFDGEELYPSMEEKAANLLYFVVKNHSFSDGNKRIAAFLFVWFLDKNKMLYREDGTKRIADNALVALTLLIAESDPKEKEMMVKVVVNLINYKN
ncbi:virulence protein RhuM/Fic/DOC family protein [Pedobacter sp. MR2016-19]|uniref:virulence protein RhuM/Fic/DOC family protein n=1 Tax=Pedobacter sp. MR2016-19 TaxID=2780089 RepID=UPI001876915C|nr:virulence protein RhuM/Fic/DOC family protein [Pedobacter sp. MR2016-19]MBE5321791.1 virulence protein RhuM/Fic/DOC family protein [Pedobacter sp. MR2016-19]